MNTKNILWVDDDVSRFALLLDRDELESRGCKIIEAPNPNELIKVLRDQLYHIDCIIVDMVMPSRDLDMVEAGYGTRTGLSLIKLIRETDSKYKDVKIIVYSVLGDEDVRKYCRDNAIPYLNKAIESKEFADYIMEYLK